MQDHDRDPASACLLSVVWCSPPLSGLQAANRFPVDVPCTVQVMCLHPSAAALPQGTFCPGPPLHVLVARTRAVKPPPSCSLQIAHQRRCCTRTTHHAPRTTYHTPLPHSSIARLLFSFKLLLPSTTFPLLVLSTSPPTVVTAARFISRPIVAARLTSVSVSVPCALGLRFPHPASARPARHLASVGSPQSGLSGPPLVSLVGTQQLLSKAYFAV